MKRDGSSVWVLVEGIAAQDRQSPERLCRATVIDISAQKRADDLAAANQALEAEMAVRKGTEEARRALTQTSIAADASQKRCMGESFPVESGWHNHPGCILAHLPWNLQSAQRCCDPQTRSTPQSRAQHWSPRDRDKLPNLRIFRS